MLRQENALKKAVLAGLLVQYQASPTYRSQNLELSDLPTGKEFTDGGTVRQLPDPIPEFVGMSGTRLGEEDLNCLAAADPREALKQQQGKGRLKPDASRLNEIKGVPPNVNELIRKRATVALAMENEQIKAR